MLLLITHAALAQECPKTKASPVLHIEDPRLTELSGITLGSDKRVWVHNDSGDGPYLYGLEQESEAILKVTVLGATAQDWEDLAIDRTEQGNFLFIADLGDNKEKRTRRAVYVVKEPLGAEAPVVSTLNIDYGGLGPKDVEAIAVDPLDHSLYLTTKGRGGTVYVLRLPLENHKASGPVELVHSYPISKPNGKYNLKYVTAMDISPDGTMMVIRDYSQMKLWKKDQTQSWKEALNTKPCSMLLPLQPQGESIAFSENSSSLWTVSEKENQPLYEINLSFKQSTLKGPE